MLKRWFHISFFAFAVLEIVSLIFNLSSLHFVAKPLLVIFLAVTSSLQCICKEDWR